jgi:hypothetical protein
MKEIDNTLFRFIEILKIREKKMKYKISQRGKTKLNCNHEIYFAMYRHIDGYCIQKDNRKIIFKLGLLNNQYLQFAIIDDIIIAIDIQKTNEAKEWNIINYNTKYLITKTLESFFSNKVWAWLDRQRTIWKEEVY